MADDEEAETANGKTVRMIVNGQVIREWDDFTGNDDLDTTRPGTEAPGLVVSVTSEP